MNTPTIERLEIQIEEAIKPETKIQMKHKTDKCLMATYLMSTHNLTFFSNDICRLI